MRRMANFRHGLAAKLRGTVMTSISAWSGCVESSTPDRSESTARKSTRLNSSHVSISYAVFCLKKKTEARHGDAREGQRYKLQHLMATQRDHQPKRHGHVEQ